MGIYEAVPLLIVTSIPLVAIVGGITFGIVKSLSKQRLIELAQKERIAAIERGLDPDKLPSLELPAGLFEKNGMTFEQKQVRRSQLLMIWGVITSSFGVAMAAMLFLIEGDPEAWAPGILFVMVGVALMISARIVKPAPEETSKPEVRP
jgi:hypothetical protein